MQKYDYNGKTYIYNNGKWLTSSYTSVPLATVSALNKLITSSENFEDKTVDELREIAKKARDSKNYQLAQKAILSAMETASVNDILYLLPMLTSNYRQLGMPEKAIEVTEEYNSKYGYRIHSCALWTSVGAAYADLEDFNHAKKYADIAYALSNGKGSPELSGLYGRIRSYVDE